MKKKKGYKSVQFEPRIEPYPPLIDFGEWCWKHVRENPKKAFGFIIWKARKRLEN